MHSDSPITAVGISLLRPRNPRSLTDREDFFSRIKLPEGTPHVTLHTCDRSEVYCGDGAASPQLTAHLFAVAAGLNSPLVGENAIQGQVKRAYQEAQHNSTVSSGLHRLFQHALRTGKRVRSETGIGRGAVSHGHGVLRMLQDLMPAHSGRHLASEAILLVGASDCSRSLLALLRKHHTGPLYIANRTIHRAEGLAEQFAAQALPLSAIPAVAPFCRAIISSTSAAGYVVTRHSLPDDGKARFLFDLAVPRDIDPALARRSGCRVCNIEDVEQHLLQTHQQRQAALPTAWQIVNEEVRRYLDDTNRMSQQRTFAGTNRRTFVAVS